MEKQRKKNKPKNVDDQQKGEKRKGIRILHMMTTILGIFSSDRLIAYLLNVTVNGYRDKWDCHPYSTRIIERIHFDVFVFVALCVEADFV